MKRVMLLILMLAATRVAAAADVKIDAPSVVWVDDAFRIQVEVTWSDAHEPPVLPDVPGLVVEGEPELSEGTFQASINGRRIFRRTSTYTFSVRASAVDSYMLPAFIVEADNQQLRTRALLIRAVQGEAEELAFARFVTKRDRYYVGESFEVTLEIWIQEYTDDLVRYDWAIEDSWNSVDLRSSKWGSFAGAVQNVLSSNPRRPFSDPVAPGRVETRVDPDGTTSTWHVFPFTGVARPRSAGPLELEPISVRVEYPESLVRNPLGRLTVRARAIRVAAMPPEVEVVEPPREGRPAIWSGAVGRFGVSATATPVSISVGDPITIEYRITDLDESGGLDGVQVPPLDEIPVLDDFTVPDEPLAGEVRGRVKLFEFTARARNDTVDALPAIPFAYFDPELGQYEMVASEPVPLNVMASEVISFEDAVGGVANNRDPAADILTETGGVMHANAVGADLLASATPFRFSPLHAALVGVPPVAVLMGLVGTGIVRRRRADPAGARRRKAATLALGRINAAGADAAEAGSAVCDYVADRLGRAPGSVTAGEVAELLHEAGVDEAVVRDVAACVRDADLARYGGGGGDGTVDRAQAAIAALEEARWS